MSTPDGGVAAALLQMSRLAEQFGGLDARESEHFRDVSAALTGLAEAIDGIRAAAAGQGKVLVTLKGIDRRLAALETAIAPLLPPNPGPGHNPAPAVPWWDENLSDTDRAKAVARLRGWVDDIYRPHYGHLAAQLGDCWEQHPLCLISIDWLSELWAVLYLRPARTAGVLNSQAEYGTRILPAAAAQLAAETGNCTAHRAATAPRGWAASAANGWAGRR